ncbi:hypothetical protein Taro_030874, partial [Colocasia esculenta]|nr:hypothetical protein [Colocasia esculenta]
LRFLRAAASFRESERALLPLANDCCICIFIASRTQNITQQALPPKPAIAAKSLGWHGSPTPGPRHSDPARRRERAVGWLSVAVLLGRGAGLTGNDNGTPWQQQQQQCYREKGEVFKQEATGGRTRKASIELILLCKGRSLSLSLSLILPQQLAASIAAVAAAAAAAATPGLLCREEGERVCVCVRERVRRGDQRAGRREI